MDHAISLEDIAASANKSEPDGNIPIFHNRIVEDDAETEKTGKRAYKEIPYVKVLSPGNDKELPDFKVTQVHKDRWPRQWAAFITKEELPLEGTPLEKWHGITPVEVKMLSDVKCRTVEDLIKIPDSNLSNIGKGFVTLKHRAEAFLSSQEGDAGYNKLKTENMELKSQVETLTEQMQGLEQRVTELLTAKTVTKTARKKE